MLELPHPVLQTCLTGRHELISSMWLFIWNEPMNTASSCDEDCAKNAYRILKEAIHTTRDPLAPMFMTHEEFEISVLRPDFDEAGNPMPDMCGRCFENFKVFFLKGREVIWMSLPQTFSLTKWDDLKDFGGE